jgi:hypothetical protein
LRGEGGGREGGGREGAGGVPVNNSVLKKMKNGRRPQKKIDDNLNIKVSPIEII